jgi:hypothetical protein
MFTTTTARSKNASTVGTAAVSFEQLWSLLSFLWSNPVY